MPTSPAAIAKANKPASSATLLEFYEGLALLGSIARDGNLSPETHAQYAQQAAAALINRQAQVSE